MNIFGQKTTNNAAIFFTEIVEPTVADFLKKPDDKRLGHLACLCLSHMADHIFYSWTDIKDLHKTPKKYRKYLGTQNLVISKIFDIANAIKHVELYDKDKVGYNAIQTEPICCGNLRCGWPINGNYLMVNYGSEQEKDCALVKDLVQMAMDFWSDTLHSRSIQPTTNTD